MRQLLRLVSVCTFLFVCSLSLVNAQKPGKPLIKVISYNILDGFEWGKEPEREQKMIEWIKSQAPDVMALQELCGFTEAKLKEFAKACGHEYVAIVKEEGYPVGITSNAPIEVISKNLRGYHHGMLHAKTYDMDFIITHLSPFEWQKRKSEVEQILQYIREKKLEKYLVMGDMNAYSPFDATVLESHGHLMKRMVITDMNNVERKNMNNLNYDYSVISAFLAANLNDVCRIYVSDEKRMTYPTPILNGLPKGETLNQYQERLDYIFVSDVLLPCCVDAYVYNGPENDYLSDHYPVGVVIRSR